MPNLKFAASPAPEGRLKDAESKLSDTQSAATSPPDFETYTSVLQALMSCQERINNYRRMITELTAVLEKLESLNGYYLSCIIAKESAPMRDKEQL